MWKSVRARREARSGSKEAFDRRRRISERAADGLPPPSATDVEDILYDIRTGARSVPRMRRRSNYIGRLAKLRKRGEVDDNRSFALVSGPGAVRWIRLYCRGGGCTFCWLLREKWTGGGGGC